MHLLMLLLMHLFMILLMHLLILLTAQPDRKQLITVKMQGARERNGETPDFLRSVAQTIRQNLFDLASCRSPKLDGSEQLVTKEKCMRLRSGAVQPHCTFWMQ